MVGDQTKKHKLGGKDTYDSLVGKFERYLRRRVSRFTGNLYPENGNGDGDSAGDSLLAATIGKRSQGDRTRITNSEKPSNQPRKAIGGTETDGNLYGETDSA